jgi:hypothetical protein
MMRGARGRPQKKRKKRKKSQLYVAPFFCFVLRDTMRITVKKTKQNWRTYVDPYAPWSFIRLHNLVLTASKTPNP